MLARRIPFHAPALPLALLAVAIASLVAPPSALAASAGPALAIKSIPQPTSFSTATTKGCEETGGYRCDLYLVTVTNVGAEPTTGSIVVRDTLPAGVTLYGRADGKNIAAGNEDFNECTEPALSTIQCVYEGVPLTPGGVLAITIDVVDTGGGAAAVTNRAEVEGSGAGPVRTSEPTTVSNTLNGEAPAFGIEDFGVDAYGPGGVSDDRAGDHPEALSTTINYTNVHGSEQLPSDYLFTPVEEPKTEIVDLPLGFLGDPLAAVQCPESRLYDGNLGLRHCPAASQIGTATVEHDGTTESSLFTKIYNVVPEAGYPAMFGFELAETEVYLRARVTPSPSGYVVSVSAPDVPRSAQVNVTGVSLTFFGDPAEQDGEATPSAAFFSNPTDCSTGPLNATLEMNSWEHPDRWVKQQTTIYEASPTQGLSGCNMLQFNPTIEVKPEETEADTPTGYEVDLKVSQAPNLAPDLATPDLKNAEVTFPAGVAVSPGAADGLAACQEAGPEGINITHGWASTGEQPLDPADPEAMEIAADGLPHVAPGHCPAASQIGTVEIATPLLASPLQGHVYLAQPKCGGAGQPACTPASASDGELFGIYLEAAGSGVIVKLKGNVSVNPSTGQVTTTFEENPQLPFSELKLRLNGGPRAPLANPQTCGQATTTSSLEPWSAPESGPAATPFSSFDVSGCTGEPFGPGFLAQTENPLAGAFSPFTLKFSRKDGEQDLSAIAVQTPPGLLGKVAGVAQCSEAQANAGTCGPESQIGTTTAASGSGSEPLYLGGRVYLTGPYEGQPFGLSIVVPAVAGPFNLGNVVVRASIAINPYTAAITAASGPLPQIVDGVPTRLQTINVTLNRPGFMFNPTDCDAQAVTATIASAQGASADVSTPFAAAACDRLPFKPAFSASTAGRTSKALGASLNVKITSAGIGQANIAKVDVEIPKALPTQLKTLNKACTEAQFNSNPADCPPASNVARVTVHTPLLNSPLTGPAYLVSHGNAAFPDVEIVLQGEGVKLVLDGKTQIKQGVTYSHFETVPDAPFTSFEFNSSQGELALFTAEGDLCDQKLVMPVTLTAQNGAVLTQNTPIEVTGCSTSLSVVSSKVKRKTLTLSVYAPGAGKVTAGGKGVSSGAKAYSGRGALAFTLKQTKGGRLKTKIKLTFTPSKGKKQSKTITISFKK
jgi:hypothetical protein